MNTSATSAVVLSFAKFRISAIGRNIMSCRRMRYWTGMNDVQREAAYTKLCKFSATNIVYAETKPICEIVIDVRIA